jgi:hypothetical protein
VVCWPDFVQTKATLNGFAVSADLSAIADVDTAKTASARTIVILPPSLQREKNTSSGKFLSSIPQTVGKIHQFKNRFRARSEFSNNLIPRSVRVKN